MVIDIDPVNYCVYHTIIYKRILSFEIDFAKIVFVRLRRPFSSIKLDFYDFYIDKSLYI